MSTHNNSNNNNKNNAIITTLLLFLLVLCRETAAQQSVLTLGCIYPFASVVNGQTMQRIVEIAAREVNDKQTIPNYNISFIFRDSLANSVTTVTEVFNLLEVQNVLGIVGDAYSFTTISSQRIATVYQAPQISHSATAAELSDKSEYPTFMRVVPPDSYQALVMAQMVVAFGWKKVAFIHTSDAYGMSGLYAFQRAAKDLNITMLATVALDFSSSSNVDISQEMQLVYDSKAKIIIVFALPTESVEIIEVASQFRLFTAGHAWIGSDGVLGLTKDNFILANKSHLIQYMDGFFGTITSTSSATAEYTRFTELMQSNNLNVLPPSPAAQFDVVLAYGEALKRMVATYNIPANRTDLFTRSNLLQSLYSISGNNGMSGATGIIAFDANGDNFLAYDIWNWRASSQGWVGLGKWQQGAPLPSIIFPGNLDSVNDDPLSGTISIGALFGLNKGSTNFASYQAAIDDINDENLIPGIIFELLPDVQESAAHSISSAFDMVSKSVIGIVGPTISDICKPVAQVLGTFNVPQISPAASSPIFSNKKEFPYFARTTPSDVFQVNAFIAILKYYGWTKVGYLYTNDDYGVNSFQAFEDVAKVQGIEIVVSAFFSVSDLKMDLALKNLKEGKARVIIASVHTNACGAMMRTIIENGFATKDYAWIHGDACSQFDRTLLTQNNPGGTNWLNDVPGMIGVAPAFGSGDRYEALLDRMVAKNYTFRDLTTNKQLLRSHGYLTYSYDAIYAFAVAVKKVADARQDFMDGSILLKALLAVDFDGFSGRVQFDANGDRKSAAYSILNWMNTSSTSFTQIGKWDSGTDVVDFYTPITWLGGGTNPPNDVPSDDRRDFLIMVIVIPMGVALIALTFVVVYFATKKEHRERLLAGEWDDETYNEAEAVEAGEGASVVTVAGLVIDKKRLAFDISNTLKFPIDEKRTDHFTVTNTGASAVQFRIFAPQSQQKFSCKIYPGKGILKKGESVEITVKLKLHCTTIINHYIKVEVPGSITKYSCVNMKFEGEMSDKLDPDELEISKTLGKGAFGTVYKGTYRGTEVAIKMMNAQADYIPLEQKLEFEKELALLRKLKHPHVVSFVACSLIPNKMCLVTEFCEIGELRNFMGANKGDISFAYKFRILLDVARGMAFLHANGVFHRDIKPDNVLLVSHSVESNIVAKISDFGTARSLALDQIQTPVYHTKAIGTPSYMAPELYMNQPYSNKVDIYSFGILMWEVITEQFPFYFIEKPWDVAVYVISGKKNPIPVHYPASVVELIETCWAQDPIKRPSFPTIVAKLEELFAIAMEENDFMRSKTNILESLEPGDEVVPKFSKTKKRGITLYSIKY